MCLSTSMDDSSLLVVRFVPTSIDVSSLLVVFFVPTSIDVSSMPVVSFAPTSMDVSPLLVDVSSGHETIGWGVWWVCWRPWSVRVQPKFKLLCKT